MDDSKEIKSSKVEDLKPGPIAHDSLTEEQLTKIKLIHTSFEEVFPISLEKTVTNFKRDQNPDNQITSWLKMVSAYKSFTKTNDGPENYDKRKEAFKLLLLSSMMPLSDVIKDLKLLSDIEIKEILQAYQNANS